MYAMRIRFEDDGQDFLRWDLDADGKVVDCWPCQGRVWLGAHVLHCAALRKGQRPTIRLKSEAATAKPHVLQHRIASIEISRRYTRAVVLTQVAP